MTKYELIILLDKVIEEVKILNILLDIRRKQLEEYHGKYIFSKRPPP